ncbi:MAG: V-type ATP synthase subunit I [Clostridium sp.]|nr:V-type ATP synthase subunit I [Clostridium sp.]
MAITKLNLVNILSDNEHLDEVLNRFIELDDFHPEPASKLVGTVQGLTTLYYENPYLKMLNRIKEVELDMGLEVDTQEIDVTECDLEAISRFVERTHDKYDEINSSIKEIEQLIQENEDALRQVKNIDEMEVAMEDLFASKYIATRVGRLPLSSLNKLQFYNNRPFIWRSFGEDNYYSWGIYISTRNFRREVDNVFSSLYFERIHIPDFVHGTPEKAIENLEKENRKFKDDLEELVSQKKSLILRTRERYTRFTGILIHLSRVFEARKYVLGFGARFAISGFIPVDKVDDLKKTFEDLDNVEIEVRPAYNDQRLSPPTKLKNGWFSRPFAMFVEMYGVPNYKDMDPTPFVAITYTILFGIMFGDVGQGALLSILGYLLFKKTGNKLGAIGARIGLSSIFFGFLYGSIFGNEEILTHAYQGLGLSGPPIPVLDPSFTMTLLIASIAIGALLIVSVIILNMVTSYKSGNKVELLFSNNGLSGLIMYSFVMIGAGLQLGGIANPFNSITISLFVLLPLVLIFLKEAIERKVHNEKMFPNGFGGFFTEAFFELFEIVLSFITNTMSYLRVAGFVLTHAGMMLVVFTLMDMSSSGGPIIFVLGNLFVMGLEILIVGIQVLRLEFYEMFSRYYQGDGVSFKSLKESL